MAHSNRSDDSSVYTDSYSSEDYSSVESNSSMNASTSVLTTPYLQKAGKNSKRVDMYAALKADLKDCFVMVQDTETDFFNFLIRVYNITQKDIDYIKTKEGGWVLDPVHLANFQKVLKDRRHEHDLYAPLKGMVDAFLATMEVDRQALDIQLVTLGTTELKCPYSGIKRKPDGLFLPRSFDSSTKPTWDVSKAYLEVYKSRSAATVEPLALGETTSAHSSTARSSTVVASKSSNGTRETKPVASGSRSKAQRRSVKGHSSRSHASNTDPPRRSSRPKTAPSMSMQSIAEDEDEGDNNGNGNDSDGEYTGGSKVGSKRGRRSNAFPRKRVNTGVHNKVCQSASYAIESLSATPRRWVTGLLVQDSDIGVHYFDRCGGIVTYPFDFIKEPAKFALVLLAIGKASLTQVGYDPYFVCSGSTSLDNGLPSMSNGQLLIPPSEDCDPESYLYTGASVPDSEWSRFVVAEKPLYVYRGLNGRGSIVWPGRWITDGVEEVIPQDTTDDDVQPPQELTTASPTRDSCLTEAIPTNHPDGQGTTSPGANNPRESKDIEPTNGEAVTTSTTSESLDQIVKLSWPDVARPRQEPAIIRELFEKIPSLMHDHLPEIHASVLMTADVAGLPRVHFINGAVGDFKTQFELGIRHFTIMVGERYQHLWMVQSVEEFENLYVDLVECHYYAYRYAGILHRDLSENNLMWRRKKGKVLGVVIDWDLASPINEATASQLGRTGTGPFMARDLLQNKNKTIGHLYRHDLESLFYVLIWSVVHNVPSKTPHRVSTPTVITPWQGAFAAAATAKAAFLGSDRDTVLEHVQPVFKDSGIVERWLKSVWWVFYNADHARLQNSDSDLSSMITFDAYMAALKRTPRLPREEYPFPPEAFFA